jgi:hypothetical protein
MDSAPCWHNKRDSRNFPRRALLLFAPVGFVSFVVSCQQQPEIRLQQSKPGAALTSVIYTGDPDAAPQLVDGFFEIEEYSWRWTAQTFSVVLRPPGGVTGEKAALVVNLAIPAIEIDQLGRVTLTAGLGRSLLSPEIFTKPGSYTYTREISGALLTKENIRVDFRLDKAMRSPGPDVRELGIIVKSISLEPR